MEDPRSSLLDIIGNNLKDLKIGKDLNSLFLSLNSLSYRPQYSLNSLKSTKKYLKIISLKTLNLPSAQWPIILSQTLPNLSKLSILLQQLLQVLQLGSPQPLWPLMKILAKHCRLPHLHPQVLCLLSHKILAKHCRPQSKKKRLSQFHGDG